MSKEMEKEITAANKHGMKNDTRCMRMQHQSWQKKLRVKRREKECNGI